jgi:hypothetical protein
MATLAPGGTVEAMSGTWSHLARCLDLQEDDVARAIGTGASTRELLAHLAAISAPDTGVAKVMLVFARMATTACEWLDGGLRVELTADGKATRVDLTTDLGGGLLERALPAVVLQAPLVEFTRAIERVPRMVAPLQVASRGGKHLVLTASALVRKTSAPPPPIEIAAESLFVRAPAPLPASRVHPESIGVLPTVDPRGPASEQPAPDTVDGGWDD